MKKQDPCQYKYDNSRDWLLYLIGAAGLLYLVALCTILFG